MNVQNQPTTVRGVAERALTYLETITLANGDPRVVLTDEYPHWMCQLVRTGEGSFALDDQRYEFIQEALVALTEASDDEIRHGEVAEYLPEEVYTANFTAWLASNSGRVEYLSDALHECGGAESGFDLLAQAYRLEQEEVLYLLLDFIQDEMIVEDDDEEEGEDDDGAE